MWVVRKRLTLHVLAMVAPEVQIIFVVGPRVCSAHNFLWNSCRMHFRQCKEAWQQTATDLKEVRCCASSNPVKADEATVHEPRIEYEMAIIGHSADGHQSTH